MPQSKEALLKEVDASKLPEPVKEFVRKSIDLAPEIDAAAKLWQDLRAKNEAADENIPSVAEDVAPVAAAAPAPVAAVPTAEVFKSLDAGTQAELAKAVDGNPGLAKALDALAKQGADALQKARDEENKRLDAEAVQKSRDTFQHVAIDHDTVAPALRKMEAEDPAAYAVVIDTLTKAEGQLEAAGMFKEIGTAQAAQTGSAMQKAQTLAQGFVTAGTVKTIPEGLAKAFESDPNLYTEYEKEASRGR